MNLRIFHAGHIRQKGSFNLFTIKEEIRFSTVQIRK